MLSESYLFRICNPTSSELQTLLFRICYLLFRICYPKATCLGFAIRHQASSALSDILSESYLFRICNPTSSELCSFGYIIRKLPVLGFAIRSQASYKLCSFGYIIRKLLVLGFAIRLCSFGYIIRKLLVLGFAIRHQASSALSDMLSESYLF